MSLDTIVLQRGSNTYIIYKFCNHRNPRLNKRKTDRHFTTSTLLPTHNRSDRSIQPVRPACTPAWIPVRPVQQKLRGRTPLTQTCNSSTPWSKGLDPPLPTPPHLCGWIWRSRGRKSTSGCPVIQFGGNKPWATNTQQDLPDQWVWLSPHT